jgi:hypothetical protein
MLNGADKMLLDQCKESIAWAKDRIAELEKENAALKEQNKTAVNLLREANTAALGGDCEKWFIMNQDRINVHKCDLSEIFERENVKEKINVKTTARNRACVHPRRSAHRSNSAGKISYDRA